MIPKKLTLTTIVLIIVFFTIRWILTQPIISGLTDYYRSIMVNTKIVASSLGEQFKIHLFSSISLGLIPFICFIAVMALIKTRNKQVSLTDYWIYLLYILCCFVAGALLRIFLLRSVIKTIDNQGIPYITNPFSMHLIKFHDWGLIAALVICLLIFRVSKKPIIKLQ